MDYYTFAQIKDRVRREPDLLDEPLIDDTILGSFINDGIDKAEKEILKLNEDYFLTKSTISLTSGTADYSLPSGIYAQKIRGIIYENGSIIYTVHRLRDPKMFLNIAYANQYVNTNDNYMYILRNDSAAAGMVMQLVPSARETTSNVLTIWYIRNANRLSSDSDLCDIPEWVQYIVQYAKAMCVNKLNPGSPEAAAELAFAEAMRKDMVSSLTNRVPDNNDIIPMDVRIYQEHS